jgi:RNA polymerase sigma-70 factor, ECF subfamily
MTSTSETHLITRIVNRDEEALSQLYGEYGSKVHGISLYVLKNAALAEEATQDTFLKIWDNAHRWNGNQSSIITWILAIARFTAIDLVRREHRHFNMSDVDDEINVYADTTDFIHTDTWDEVQLLQSLIAQLPEEQNEAIELAFFMGMSHQEIASHLNQPLGTIKSRIRNGLHLLRGMWIMKTS